MTDESFRESKEIIDNQHKKQLNKLITTYVKSKKWGDVDVVRDSNGAIKVESIEVELGIDGLPTCNYSGVVLRKDGTPHVHPRRRIVKLMNILKYLTPKKKRT